MKQPAPKTVDLASLFSADDILCDAPQGDRDALLGAMLRRLGENHGLTGLAAIHDAVNERAAAGATVIGHGIAIPHARLERLARPYIAVATSRRGVLFDETPARLVFLMLVPKNQPALYLQVLRSLSRLLQDEEAAEGVAAMGSPGEIMRFFERGGMVLPDYVCAADIMADPPVVLKDNDSLKTAIDLFVRLQLSEIPVTDGEDDMVGVVSADALLRVCLPDHLLWMRDLSSIIHFEPFASVLRNEETTWLSEIISDDFASVEADDPAISVAAELTRRKAATCYVLGGQKLIGVITLPRFLDKVMRE